MTPPLPSTVSVVIPALNESASLATLIPAIRAVLPEAEILVIDDGSTDDTAQVARSAGAVVVSHPERKGNGAAVKTGIRLARGQTLVLMDADGQHDPADIPRLLDRLHDGYDLVIGARVSASQAGVGRLIGNWFYNRLASWMVGHRVQDLTSGFRAVRADRLREFLSLLPNGFSYPTTSTMAFYRGGFGVAFEPIHALPRAKDSKSHIRMARDGARFLAIIFKIGALYSPLKIFLPFSAFFFSFGLVYVTYTLVVYERFTNFGALTLVTAILVFLIGLVSEQITSLIYLSHGKDGGD